VYLQEPKHALLELRAIDRLEDKLVRTELKRPWNFPDLGLGSEHDDREGGICLSDSLEHFETVQLGHLEVQADEIRARGVDGLKPGGRDFHRISPAGCTLAMRFLPMKVLSRVFRGDPCIQTSEGAGESPQGGQVIISCLFKYIADSIRAAEGTAVERLPPKCEAS
jgi:hypothetical protein